MGALAKAGIEEMIRNVTQRELVLIVNLGYVLGGGAMPLDLLEKDSTKAIGTVQLWRSAKNNRVATLRVVR